MKEILKDPARWFKKTRTSGLLCLCYFFGLFAGLFMASGMVVLYAIGGGMLILSLVFFFAGYSRLIEAEKKAKAVTTSS